MQSKYIRLTSLSLALALGACQGEDLKPESVVDKYLVEPKTTELDTWISSQFSPYNIDVRYRWAKQNLPIGSISTPPKTEQVRPALEAVERLWINLYSDAKAGGKDFLKGKAVLRLTLLGDDELSDKGVLLRLWYRQTASNEFFLFGLNSFAPTRKASVYRLMRSLHHQFARRLTEQIPYDRDAFASISPKSYGSLSLVYDAKSLERRVGMSDFALRRGFYTLYSMASPEVEFAEIVSVLLMHSAVELERAEETAGRPTTADSEAARREAEEMQSQLRAKRAFVESYFKDKLGISLSRLQLLSLRELNSYYNEHGSK